MSAAVRRMVCDIQLKWLLFAALLALSIPLLDGAWLMRPSGRMPLSTIVFVSLSAIPVAAIKLPVWRLLPVSRRQIGHAQWWLGMGAPLILIFSSLALAAVVVGLAGALRASPTEILALAGGECAFGIALSFLPLISSVLKEKLGAWVAALMAMLWAAALVALACRPPALTPILGITLPLAGAIAIAAAVAAFVFSPTVPLNDPMLARGPARGRPGSLASPGLTGWAGLWRPFLTNTAGLAVVSIGLFIGMRLLTGATDDPIATAMGMGVLVMAPIIFGARVRLSARALRGVPVSAVFLTSVLLGAMTAAQLLAFAALYLVCRLCHGPATEMLALLPLVIGFGACGLGLMLRHKAPLILALSWPVFILAGDLLSRFPAFAPAGMAVGLVGLPAGWLWIYLELSRWRSVYQSSAASGLSWRGL